MTDLTDDQVRALVARFPLPRPHRSGEALLDMVYADPGNSGFYYREEKPDSMTCYVRIDHVARALLQARTDAAAAQAAMVQKIADEVGRWSLAAAEEIEALAPDAGTAELARLRKRAERAEPTRAYARDQAVHLQVAQSHAKRAEAERDTLAASLAAQTKLVETLKGALQEVSGALHQTARDRDLSEGELAFMRKVDAAIEAATLAAMTKAEQADFDLTMRIRGAAGDIAKAQIAAREGK